MDSPSQSLPIKAAGANTDGNALTHLFSVMIVVDTIALSLWMAEWISTPQLLGLHLFGIGLLLAGSVLLNRRMKLSALLEAGFCLLAGPLGTLVLQIARLGQSLPAANASDLEDADNDLARPVSLPDAIHEMHLQGRRSKPSDGENQSYADIILHGDLLRHNEIIAAISRNYKPEMYPALSLALGSASPALKVQAAAVFSKLRRTLGDAANDLLATPLASLTAESAQDCHERMLNVARSGFVDAEKAQALIARAGEIARLGLVASIRPSPPTADARKAIPLLRDMRKSTPRLKRYSCGGVG